VPKYESATIRPLKLDQTFPRLLLRVEILNMEHLGARRKRRERSIGSVGIPALQTAYGNAR